MTNDSAGPAEAETETAVAPVRLYTASWRKLHRFGGGKPAFVPVRTSVGKPRFIRNSGAIPFIGELAPYGLLKIEDWEEFRTGYRHRLHKHGVAKIEAAFAELRELYDDLPLALLCYEDVEAGEQCHRRLFADWWAEQTGEQIPELTSFDELVERPRQLRWHDHELAPEEPRAEELESGS